MSSHSESLPLPPTSLAPVREWIDEMRHRLEGWTSDAGTWRAFLTTIGLKKECATTVEEVECDLRARVTNHRRGLTIECYEQYIVTPPQIKL